MAGVWMDNTYGKNAGTGEYAGAEWVYVQEQR